MSIKQIGIKLTEEQYNLIAADAKKADRSVSAQIRWELFGDKNDG